MNGRRRVIAAAGIVVFGSLLAAGLLRAHVQETPQDALKSAPAAAPGPETPAAPRPAKERMAAYVLLAWAWVSIVVLLGLLRLRVREADRVHRMGLRRATGQAPKDLGH
jgi:hypothetical protein